MGWFSGIKKAVGGAIKRVAGVAKSAFPAVIGIAANAFPGGNYIKAGLDVIAGGGGSPFADAIRREAASDSVPGASGPGVGSKSVRMGNALSRMVVIYR